MYAIYFARRYILKLSQSEIAKLCGVSRATIASWEKGKTSPEFHHIEAIRAQIVQRKLPWNDSWWFDPPQYIVKGLTHARNGKNH